MAIAVVVGYAVARYFGAQSGALVAVTLTIAILVRLYRPQAESKRWRRGARGEERTARIMRSLERDGWTVFHDLAVPRSRANLDALALAPDGGLAVLVDSKAWHRRSRVRVRDAKLFVGSYDQTAKLKTLVWEAGRAVDALGVNVVAVIAVHGPEVPRGLVALEGVVVLQAEHVPEYLRQLAPGAPAPLQHGALSKRVCKKLPPAPR